MPAEPPERVKPGESAGPMVIVEALRGRPCPRPPFWFLRQAGRYLPEYRALRRQVPDFLEFCYTPELSVEAALQPIRRFGCDAAILFSDILVVPDALGWEVRFVDGTGPMLRPFRRAEEIGLLDVDRCVERLAPVYRAVAALRRALPSEIAVIGFAGAPWTLALYLVEGRGGSDGSTVRRWAYGDPDTFARLIERLTVATVEYLDRQIEHGADVVQLFDSWSGMLAEEGFRRWVIEPTRQIVTALKRRHPHVLIIGYPRQAGVLYRDFVDGTRVDGVNCDALVSLRYAREELQPVATVQGNLDNAVVLAGGETLERQTRRLLEVLAPGRLIVNLGHGVLPETPPEHVLRVADLVREWPCR